MGWNLSVVHAQGPAATVEGFALTNGYRPLPNQQVATIEEVVSRATGDPDPRPTLAVTDTAAGMLLAAPLILTHSWGAELSARRGTATWAVWQRDDHRYAFAHYRDGELVRELARHGGEPTLDLGPALAEETGLDWSGPTGGSDEDALFTLLGRLTGLPDAARWLEAPARLYAPAAITELELPAKKRRLFRR